MGKSRSRQAIGLAKAHLVLTWWIIVVMSIAGAGVLSLAVSLSTPPLSVHRVVGDDANLWAETWEPFWMDGDTAWQVSRDGGRTWSEAPPPAHVRYADPVTEVCTHTACYRLVDGVRIERKTTGDERWELVHERDAEPFQHDEWRDDDEEDAAIAATNRADRNDVIVAGGAEGVLVLTESGSWSSAAVGTSIYVRFVRWLLPRLVAVLVVIGVAGHLVIRGWARRRAHTSVISAVDSS